MTNVKISVVTTVLNEEDSIYALLDSLLHQSRLPDELIVVDAGSTDQTVEIIKEHHNVTSFPILTKVVKNANRSQGRNIGIGMAEYNYIAVIDAGCEADSQWLQKIESGFNEGFEVVAGFYLPVIDQPIQQLFIPFLSTSPERVNADTFLPSSRSLGFTKDAWANVGGYPEELPTCEDLVFADKLRAQHSTVVKTEAFVHWHMVRTLKGFFNQVAGYAFGDILAGYRQHVKKIITMWARYLLFLICPYLLPFYAAYRLYTHRAYVNGLSAIPRYLIVMFTADAGVLWGSLRAGLKR